MLSRAFTGRYALLRDRLVFVQAASQESPREHTGAKTEGTPPCTHMALKTIQDITRKAVVDSEQNTDNEEQDLTVHSPWHP